MIKIAIAFTAMFLLLASPHSSTAQSYTGLVTLNQVLFMRGGIVLFTVSGTRTNIPSCSTVARFALDASTVSGQAQLAGLLTAFSTAKPLVLFGTGACDVWADTETLNYYYISE